MLLHKVIHFYFVTYDMQLEKEIRVKNGQQEKLENKTIYQRL